MYSFCLDTLEVVAVKKQKHFHKKLQISDKLFLLAAKCTKHVYDSQSNDNLSSGDEEDDPNPMKKSMRYRSFQNVLSEICGRMAPSESLIVWVNYLTAVLTQFPQLVECQMNFTLLFNMGCQFLKTSFVTKRDIYVYFLSLLNAEKYLVETQVLKCRSKTWENVWDLTIRYIYV